MRRPLRWRGAAPTFTAALAGIVYVNGLNNPFVYDDHRVIVNNPTIRNLLDLRTIVLGGATRPIVNLSYAIDHAVWGTNAFGFHMTNVLLHVLNALLLYRLTWHLVDDIRGAAGGEGVHVRAGAAAFVAATLMAVHPILSEAVGYVSGRSEVLCATFFLAAVLAGRQWLLLRTAKWGCLTAALWVAALGTKEVAAIFPLVLLLYDRFVLATDLTEHRGRVMRLHAPVIGLAAIIGIVRLLVLVTIEHPGATSVQWQLLLVDLDVVQRYVGLILVPEGQTISHAVPITRWLQAGAVWAVAVPASIAAAAWWMRRRHGGVSLGLCWFLLALVPSAVLVMLDHAEPMAEHRVYVACAGLFMALGISAAWLRAQAARFSDRLTKVLTAVFCMLLLSLATRTFVRNVIWSSEVLLWVEARDRAPDHWLPHLLLAQALDDVGRAADAVPEYAEALRLRPGEEVTYRKLGASLIRMQRYDEATTLFDQLRVRRPQSATPLLGHAAIALAQRDTAGARTHFLAALEQDSRNIEARQSLAVLAEQDRQNPAEALRWCREIHEIAPATPGNADCIARSETQLSNTPAAPIDIR